MILVVLQCPCSEIEARMNTMRSPVASSALFVVSAILAGCTPSGEKVSDSAAAAVASADTVVAKCVGDNAGLTLPSGVCATIFADSIGRGRHVAIASNGDVYVALEGTAPNQK